MNSRQLLWRFTTTTFRPAFLPGGLVSGTAYIAVGNVQCSLPTDRVKETLGCFFYLDP